MDKIKRTRPVKDGHEIKLGRAVSPPQGSGQEVKKLRKICATASKILQLASASQRRRTQLRKNATDRSSSKSLAAMKSQRVAVRITYTGAKSPSHWKQHGSYLQREAAAGKDPAGFNGQESGVDIPTRLDQWQKSGDERIWRVIISPEEGERLSMNEYTKLVMERVEKETGLQLDWVGVVHSNTDNPHAHVAIRGVTRDGKEVFFPKEFVQAGFRAAAQTEATAELGYRTREQIEAALVREMNQDRFTSLDRLLQRAGAKSEDGSSLSLTVDSPAFQKVTNNDPATVFTLERRLYHLQELGLARPLGSKRWQIDGDFEKTLRTFQMSGDIQKMLGRSMEAASSVGQPIVKMNWQQIDTLHARILGHGEDETTGKRFMMLETISGNVIYLPHRADSETMRSRQLLNRDHFVTFSRSHRGALQVLDHGTAHGALEDRALMTQLVREQPAGADRPGWLGALDAAMERAATGAYEKPEPRTAIRLTREEVSLLFNGAYARHTHGADNAFRDIHGEAGRATLRSQGIDIQFSEKTQNYFAFVTQSEKTRLTNSLSDLSHKKQRADARAKEREHQRG